MALGGAERILLTLADGSRARGHDVALLSRHGPLAAEFTGPVFEMPELRRRASRVPLGARAVATAVRRWSPDVLHAHNPGMALAAAMATRRGRRRPCLVSIQGVPEDEYRISATVLRVAGLPVVACGVEVGDGLQRHGCRVIEVIENTVTPAPPPADRATLEREWALTPGRPLIVAVGRLVEQKNHRLAVRALAHVPEASLVVIGDGPLRGAIEAEALVRGVADRVVLAGSRDDARAIIGAADALVLSSRWEGLPLVVLEAMAAGTPVVAVSAVGLREALASDSAALLVDQDDEIALASALRRVMSDRALRARMSVDGLGVAATRSHEGMVDRFVALYEQLAGAR